MDIHEKPILTYALIALIFAAFAYELYLDLLGRDALAAFINTYGFSLQALIDGKWWTLFTSIFLHAGADHLLLNVLALFFFGRVVEHELGWRKFLVIYFVSAVAGHFATITAALVGIVPIGIPTIGASAAIFGLMGTAMIVKPLEMIFYPYIIPLPLGFAALLYAAYNVIAFVVVITTGVPTQIAFAAHLGGLLAGTYFGLRYVSRKQEIIALLLLILFLAAIPYLWSALQYLENLNYTAIFSSPK